MFDYHYYENQKDRIKIVNLEPLEDYIMRIYFSNGKVKKYDFKPYLDTPAFKPLKDTALFSAVKLQSGTAHWNYDYGKNYAKNIDISETALYWDSVPDSEEIYA
jgi:hypothetical protein